MGRIVETEAYTQEDPACHASHLYDAETGTVQLEGRAADLFAPAGTAYVYLIYGVHWLLNVVTEPDGTGGAVLIRAVEPVEGLGAMRSARGDRSDRELTNGPGKLAEAFGIDDSFHGTNLTENPLFFAADSLDKEVTISTSSRIGISKAVDRPWRFYIYGNAYVSQATPSAKSA